MNRVGNRIDAAGARCIGAALNSIASPIMLYEQFNLSFVRPRTGIDGEIISKINQEADNESD